MPFVIVIFLFINFMNYVAVVRTKEINFTLNYCVNNTALGWVMTGMDEYFWVIAEKNVCAPPSMKRNCIRVREREREIVMEINRDKAKVLFEL